MFYEKLVPQDYSLRIRFKLHRFTKFYTVDTEELIMFKKTRDYSC